MKDSKTNPVAIEEREAQPSEALSVLLIEDAVEGELVSMVLEQARIGVRHVWSLPDATESLSQGAPDLILVGWSEDAFSGMFTLRSLLSLCPALERTPIILMADHKLSDFHRYRLSRLNIKWVLEKPVVPTAIPRLIRRTARACATRPRILGPEFLPRQVDFGSTASSCYQGAVV
ncbi:MAG TPA: hypothetical protein VGP72_21445 [Planctomycetota bacterium]|jgi:DNA-binding response OmpR family regulator